MYTKKLHLTGLLVLFLLLQLKGQDHWQRIADFGAGPRYGAAAFSIGDTGYIGLGNDGVNYRTDFWAYDPAKDIWTQVADYVGGFRMAPSAFTLNRTGYVVGGVYSVGDVNWTWYNDCWAYDPGSNRWTQKSSYPGIGRNNSVAFSIGNKGYMGTGSYRQNRFVNAIYLNDFYEYDPAADQWTRKADVPTEGRNGAMGFSIGNRGYIGTGFFYYDTRQEDFYEYNPDLDQWTQKANFPGGPRFGVAGFSLGNTGYAGLGYYYSPFNDFYAYHPETNQWQRVADYGGAGREQGKAFVIHDVAYLGTGDNNTGVLSDMWAYTAAPVGLHCPAPVNLPVDPDICYGVGTNLAPVFVPADADPLITFSIVHNDDTLRKGNGIISEFLFPPGTSTVTYRLPNYPTERCQFTVQVTDNRPPAVTAPETQTRCYSNNHIYSIPELQATDACGVAAISYSIAGATNRQGEGPDASGNFSAGISTITWTATDTYGNTSQAQTEVRIDLPLLSFIPDVYPLLFLGERNTLYLGYGPSSVTLFAVAFGGTHLDAGRYTYHWSTGASTPSIQVSPNVPGWYSYTVQVTDAWGCQSTSSINLQVIDVRCGTHNDKVSVCKPAGKSYRQLCLAPNAVLPALIGGAKLGACAETGMAPVIRDDIRESDDAPLSGIRLYPNPNNGNFVVQLSEPYNAKLEWRVINATGRQVASGQLPAAKALQSINLNLTGLPNGVYTLQVVSSGKMVNAKFVIQR